MKKSAFENINTAMNRVSLQKKAGGQIIKKKAGRPKKPNSQRLQVKIDSALLSKLRIEAERQNMGVSVAVAQGVRLWLKHCDELNKYIKSVKNN